MKGLVIKHGKFLCEFDEYEHINERTIKVYAKKIKKHSVEYYCCFCSEYHTEKRKTTSDGYQLNLVCEKARPYMFVQIHPAKRAT